MEKACPEQAKRAEGNCLYYGDNLTLLREHIQDESLDPIYSRTNFVNFRTVEKFLACAIWPSSVINNEPRAFVWLAGRIFATLVRVRHLMF
jgi:hypothetical protein